MFAEAALLLGALAAAGEGVLPDSESDLRHRCSLQVQDARTLTAERWHALFKRKEPIVLVNGLHGWPAMERWSADWLKETHGDLPMKILDPAFLERRGGFAPSVGSVRLASFIAMLEEDEPADATAGRDNEWQVCVCVCVCVGAPSRLLFAHSVLFS
eukprot:COSAG03_NODE_6709_length_1017_cov_0.904139_1_plen_157_part_00